MRHLKEYNENFKERGLYFKNLESERKEVNDTIKDICLDLTDEGFKVDFVNSTTTTFTSITITKVANLYEKFEFYPYSEISDVVERLKLYLGGSLRGVTILSNGAWRRLKESDFPDKVLATMISFEI